MAKFVKQTSDIAQALDRLQGFAENLISYETNRRVQLAREKEDRVSDAYRYMIQNEESQIQEHQLAIDTVQQNLLDRGIELKSVKDEYRTIDSEELLSAANEGALEMLQVMLDDSKAQKESYESKAREANKVRRYVDMFDEAISLTDPAATGEKHLIEASDVAQAAEDFISANKEYAPEIEQRLKELQTESQLEKLQTDYYAKLARESQEKLTAAEAEYATTDIRRQRFEIIKKETAEGTRAKLFPVISSLLEQFRGPQGLRKDIEGGVDSFTGKDLTTAEEKQKRQEMAQEYNRLGVIFAPWAGEGKTVEEAEALQVAIVNAQNGNYQLLVDYFKKGYSFYNEWKREGDSRAALYEEDMDKYFNIDVSTMDWIQSLESLWNASVRADELQGEEQLKMSIDMFSEPLIDDSPTSGDPLLQEYGFE